MDCVIKIIKGPEEGQEFRCTGAESVVGRSPRSQVRLASPSASFEHAIITRTGDDFFIENLSAAGTFLNDEKITGKVRLRTRDQLRFGTDTLARVEEVPTNSAGGQRRLLVYGVIALVVILVVVMLIPSGDTPKASYKIAYGKIEAFTQREVANHDLPPETLSYLREAWRLDMSGDTERSREYWIRLQILLADQDSRLHLAEIARSNSGALARLAAPRDPKNPEPTDEDLAAALVQFVSRKAGS